MKPAASLDVQRLLPTLLNIPLSFLMMPSSQDQTLGLGYAVLQA